MRKKPPAGAASGNIFLRAPESKSDEVFEDLVKENGFKLERIISYGHKTPLGKWFNQKRNEWVLLLCGSAKLRFEDETKIRLLRPGDWMYIPARKRHRVEWTKQRCMTIWLALHY